MKYMYKHNVLKIAYHYESAVIKIPEETLEQANDIIKIEGFHLHNVVIDAVFAVKSRKQMLWHSATNTALTCKWDSFDGI